MKRLLMLAIIVASTASSALWAIPATINYQGSLKEKGLPVNNTTKQMMFRITDVTGQQVYWTSPTIAVTPQNGHFAVPLTPSGVNWESITPYIEVSVEGQMLLPREPISATVYATVSGSVVDGAITSTKLSPSVQNFLVPAGAVIPYAGSIPPPGWLLCDGAAISRSTYASLFQSIGTAWGQGDGVTTFNLPDMRGRVPLGAGQGVGLTNRPVAQAVGEELHQLTVAEMPTHSHGVTDPGHNHSLPPAPEMVNTSFQGGGSSPAFFRVDNYVGTGSTASSGTGVSIQASGSSSPHNNMQPSLAINYIIKT